MVNKLSQKTIDKEFIFLQGDPYFWTCAKLS